MVERKYEITATHGSSQGRHQTLIEQNRRRKCCAWVSKEAAATNLQRRPGIGSSRLDQLRLSTVLGREVKCEKQSTAAAIVTSNSKQQTITALARHASENSNSKQHTPQQTCTRTATATANSSIHPNTPARRAAAPKETACPGPQSLTGNPCAWNASRGGSCGEPGYRFARGRGRQPPSWPEPPPRSASPWK